MGFFEEIFGFIGLASIWFYLIVKNLLVKKINRQKVSFSDMMKRGPWARLDKQDGRWYVGTGFIVTMTSIAVMLNWWRILEFFKNIF